MSRAIKYYPERGARKEHNRSYSTDEQRNSEQYFPFEGLGLGFDNFNSLNGVDVSQSEGKEISVVSLNSKTFETEDKYDNAESIFHEISAHIENATPENDGNAEHIKYGMEWKYFKPWDAEILVLRPGSPADIINQQLQSLKREDEKK